MSTSQETLTENNSLLKIEIDHSWTANDFSDLFDRVNRIYGYQLLLMNAQNTFHRMGEEYNVKEKFSKLPEFINLQKEFTNKAIQILKNPSPNFSRIGSSMSLLFLFNSYPLQVDKVKFGSKGSVDLVGIGKIFEVLKELIMNYVPNESDKLDNLLKEKEIEEKEQQILQMRIENLKSLGLETDEILSIIGFESANLSKIKRLIDQDKIQGIEIDKHLNN